MKITLFLCGQNMVFMWCPHRNHMVSMWKPHFVHMKITCCLHANHVVNTWEPCGVYHENNMLSTCKPHGVYVDKTWFLHGHHVVAMWTQHSYHMDTTLFPGFQTPYGFHVVTMCTPCGFQVVTTMCQMWTPYDFHMKITLFLCGQNMVSMWLIFHHFYIISVANRSRKIANLWKPVTSLIMVRFSIRKKF